MFGGLLILGGGGGTILPSTRRTSSLRPRRGSGTFAVKPAPLPCRIGFKELDDKSGTGILDADNDREGTAIVFENKHGKHFDTKGSSSVA